MYFDDANFGFLFYSPAGHVSQLGNPLSQTTVNPRDVLLTQPSTGLFQSEGIPHNVPGSHSLAGYPGDIPQETLQFHPQAPVWSSQSMDRPFDIIGDFTSQFTGPVRPVRRMFRGVRVDGPVPTPCQWQSQGSLICGQEITGETVSKHLVGHGIRNMRRDLITRCCWRDCGAFITRQSITRHLREVHLGLKRKSYARASSRTIVADAN